MDSLVSTAAATLFGQKKRKLLALIMLLLSFGCLLFADENILQSLENDDDLSVGDRFYFNLRAEYPLNRVVIPDTLTNFKVIEVERITEVGLPAHFRLTIVPLLPGYHSFPSLQVQPVDSGNPIAYTDRFRLNIIPVRAESDTTLVDIKAPLKYPFQSPGWLYILAVVLLLVLAFLFFWFGRKKAVPEPLKPVAAPEPKLPNWKRSLQKLIELQDMDLLGKDMIIQHHYELSWILREFIMYEYRIAALEMTTFEIREAISRVGILDAGEVNRFLAFCDMAKFAKHKPSFEETKAMEDWLKSYLLAFEVIEAQKLLNRPQGEINAANR
jgi:hypothetical protein